MANDSIRAVTQDLPDVGSDIGGFMGNLGPGVVKFIFTMGIAGGIIFIIYGIYEVVVKSIKGTGKRR